MDLRRLVACVVLLLVHASMAMGSRAERDAERPDLLKMLPDDVTFAIAVDDAASLRAAEAGEAILSWMRAYDALPQTRHAWGLLADRVGISQAEVFDRLLGRSAALGIGPAPAVEPPDQNPPAWIVLAEVEQSFLDRLIRRSRAVPRKVVHGRTVFGLEEESFLLAALRPVEGGVVVVAMAPSASGRLLEQALRAATRAPQGSSGEGPALRGFWKPVPDDREPATPAGELARWLDPGVDRPERVFFAIGVSGREIELTIGGGAPVVGPLGDAADGVLLDVVGPGEAIVAGVLDRAGLTGLVPRGLRVSMGTGELVVRRARHGVDLGARLPLAPSMAAAASTPDAQVVHVRDLSETPSARRIFGPGPSLAWTTLDGPSRSRELVVAVTAGAAADAPASLREAPDPNRSSARSVAIVLEAAARPSPQSPGVHGSAHPAALGAILGAVDEEPVDDRLRLASLAFLVDRVRWAIDTSGAGVAGRVLLELRAPATPR